MPNITEAQAQALREARDIYSERDRKRRKAAIFADIKSSLKIPTSQRIKVEIDAKGAAYYCALKDPDTNELLQPAMPPYSGARKLEKLVAPTYADAAPTPKAKPEWAFPDGKQAGSPAVKPNPGLDRVSSTDHRMGGAHAVAADAAGPRLKLGSIAIEDALRLLRVEADATGSYASAEGYADAAVFVKNDRLFFVL
jgi:hypothetical protein